MTDPSDAAQGTRDVFILGAGFSKSISHLMPLVDELGNRCRLRVQRTHRRWPTREFSGGRFEAWLSRIAEYQADLSDVENADNRSLFLDFSRAVGCVLAEVQEAVADGMKLKEVGWLTELVQAWHERQAVVITFNYDTLIEETVEHSGLRSHGLEQGTVLWDDVINHLPPMPPSALVRMPGDVVNPPNPNSLVESFQLLKLHGSINWFWQPGDRSGATINRWRNPGILSTPLKDGYIFRNRHLPGRVPFIVPPASSKSEFYSNPITHEIWGRAAGALGRAKRVFFVGYSMPMTDLAFSGMFWEKVGTGTNVPITIVNTEPQPIMERLQILGINESRLDASFVGEDCVPQFAKHYGSE